MTKKKRTTPWTDVQMNPIAVQERLNLYVEMVQGKMDSYWKAMKFTFNDPDQIMVEYGKKYARVIHQDANGGPSRSVHTFVNMINGDILKSGSWKAPAPNGVRGNIFADDVGDDRINEMGANYLR